MLRRNQLLQKGLFPETLPPCFDSVDLVRAFGGIIRKLREKKFHNKRSASYIRYNGTKHDGNRRPYGTPNPVPYFHVAEFISNHWTEISEKYEGSIYTVSSPSFAGATDDRAIKIASLSELAAKTSKQIKYAPFVLKTDIAQFFPSVYTHTIPWVAHGVDTSKTDRKKDSENVAFNQLDWHVQQCQKGQTRGILIGPDAFRIVAEFIVAEVDQKLFELVGDKIIGAVRHVDDYYIGVASEIDAQIVLSELRNLLQNYDLHINDFKTKVISSLEPIDDLWAQKLRAIDIGNGNNVNDWVFDEGVDIERINELLDSAFTTAKETGTESPIKLALRKLDNSGCYKVDEWSLIEPKLQRILQHFPHCTDYVLLLTVKRFALNKSIDVDGWSKSAQLLTQKNIGYNNHHEITWLLWFIFVCELDISEILVVQLSNMSNSHIRALLIAAYEKGLCEHKPNIALGGSLETDDEDWLLNLVARSTGFTRARFKGTFSEEFEHLAKKKVKLIQFQKHLDFVSEENVPAISRTKYGYDDEAEEDFEEEDFEEEDLEAQLQARLRNPRS